MSLSVELMMHSLQQSMTTQHTMAPLYDTTLQCMTTQDAMTLLYDTTLAVTV